MMVAVIADIVFCSARPRMNSSTANRVRYALRVSASSSDRLRRVRRRSAGCKGPVASAVVERVKAQLLELVVEGVLETMAVIVAVCERHEGMLWRMDVDHDRRQVLVGC